jgi:hypothetical protein
MPFKIIKLIGAYLIEVFGEPVEEHILVSEKNKVKALYFSLLDETVPQVTFKQ